MLTASALKLQALPSGSSTCIPPETVRADHGTAAARGAGIAQRSHVGIILGANSKPIRR